MRVFCTTYDAPVVVVVSEVPRLGRVDVDVAAPAGDAASRYSSRDAASHAVIGGVVAALLSCATCGVVLALVFVAARAVADESRASQG